LSVGTSSTQSPLPSDPITPETTCGSSGITEKVAGSVGVAP
jgi:hypothetical protein